MFISRFLSYVTKVRTIRLGAQLDLLAREWFISQYHDVIACCPTEQLFFPYATTSRFEATHEQIYQHETQKYAHTEIKNMDGLHELGVASELIGSGERLPHPRRWIRLSLSSRKVR